MALTKERKVFLGVLLVAGGSLALDRGLIGSPNEAGAGVVEQVKASLMPDLGVGASIGTTDPNELSQITSLVQDRLFDGELEADASGVSSMFFPVAQTPSTAGVVTAAPESRTRMPRLTAIMPGANGSGTAVLDGRAVRVGQTTGGGFTLVRVVDRSVVLEREDREHVVTLPVFGRSGGS